MEDTNNNEKRLRIRRTAFALAIIVFFILVVYFRNPNNNTDGVTNIPDSTASAHQDRPQAVTAYIDFVSQDTVGMTLEHAYSSEALLKLMAATSAEAEIAGVDVGSSLTLVETYAGRITRDPYTDTHADDIREAAIVLSHALEKIQQAKFPQLAVEAASVVTAADQINPKTLALDQKNVINGFFAEAARLLAKMHSTQTAFGFYLNPGIHETRA